MLVVHMLLNKTFILASNSSSRHRLLNNAGLRFSQTNPVCDEDFIKKEIIKKKTKPTSLPKILAKEKALSVSKTKQNKLVVGADTIIFFKDKIINKASNISEAKKKLKKLSGKNHQIISCVSICFNNKEIWSKQQTSTITMKKLSNKQIDDYLKCVGEDILLSVGCYEAEKLGPQIIESIKGDFFNVLGFPLFPFLSFLKNV